MNTNFKVIDLTRLGIKPKSTAQETDALYHSAICAVKMSIAVKIVCSDRQWRSHGGGVGGYNPLPIKPQMTSYIIEIVQTKCIIAEAPKVRGQKSDKLSLKIVQKALKWPLQYANF